MFSSWRQLNVLIALLILTACGGRIIYPVTYGSHAQPEPGAVMAKRIVVWSNHAGAGNHVISLAQQVGLRVVERARLQQVFDEQSIRLTHTPDDDAAVLRVGQLIGADRVIFIEATVKSEVVRQAWVAGGYGSAQSSTVYLPSVAVRGVDVETAEIRWSGTAQYPEAIVDLGATIIALTEIAIVRALCPVEAGYEWRELTSGLGDNYCMKDGKPVNLIDSKDVMLPLL